MCKRTLKLFFTSIALVIVLGCYSQQSPRTIVDFNKDWRFLLAKDSTIIATNYDDAKWRKLDLPHDWSIEGDFSNTHPATNQGGALPGGIGWYRKTFKLPITANNKNVFIEFDGVYRNSEVWINGYLVGKRPNGYISFRYDLTPYLNKNAVNVVMAKVDNSQQPNSRWYTGSGIYRNTRLVFVNPEVSIAPWGVFISTKTISTSKVSVIVNTTLTGSAIDVAHVYTDIYDAAGKIVHSGKQRSTKVADKQATSIITINNPQRWFTDRPYQYRAVTRIVHRGKIVDETSTLFGVRDCRFDSEKGFFLNERSLKIKGVCMHHDLGALGAAVNVRAMERQLQILKAMGCNAIRTAHNPPAPEFLDLCDKMGFLVMDEAFDMWRKKKNKFDYFSDFDAWHERDLRDMVLRDRNHPSVFLWSIGNEIREQFDSSGIRLARDLAGIVKSVDSTRPVMAALSEWNPAKNFLYQSGAMDIVGLNYHHEVYEDFKKHYPGKVFLGAENMSALATRGVYDLPSDSLKFWPEHSPLKYVEKGNADFTVSAYDQVRAYWGSTHEETWKIIRKHDFMSGLFVWTGFDYLGEPIPYPWPARSSYYGIIDLAGYPKDVYYMYQAEWITKPVLHLFPHWNWKEGQLVDMWAYYNNADEVELFLNNKSLGVRRKEGEALHVQWQVPFSAGTLKAVSRKNGKTILTREIKTAGEPARIELIPDRKTIRATGKDISFVTVRILDKSGNLVPDADNNITYSIKGMGNIAAIDNGFQADTTSFSNSSRRTWKGLAIVMVRGHEKKGNITLEASSPGLAPAILSLKTVDFGN